MSPRLDAIRRQRALLLLALLLSLAGVQGAEPEKTKVDKPAKLKISGYGLLGNLELRQVARQLLGEDRKPATFNASFVEDAALVLLNRVQREGYLDAKLLVDLTLADGRTLQYQWDGSTDVLLPRPLAVRRAHFKVREGILYFYKEVNLAGLEAVPQDEARGFFYKTDFLLRLKRNLRFSHDGLQQSVNNLQQAIQNLGYRDASVTIFQIDANPKSGAVRVDMIVKEGPLYHTEGLLVNVRDTAASDPESSESRYPDQPYSRIWAQDLRQELASREFARGFPDTEVTLRERERQTNQNVVAVRLEANVIRGEPVALGHIHFEGYDKTRLSLLRRKARIDGPMLNRLEVDAARERILRLGTFKYADVFLEPDEGSPRDVRFQLEEGDRLDVSLLFGYSSFDFAFGGIEVEQHNVFGLAHNARLRAVQSFKTSTANYTYTIPDILERHISLFGSADGLRREEVSFDREELIFSVGGRKAFPLKEVQVGLRYAYEFLDARLAPAEVTDENPDEVAAFIIDVLQERRDDPLSPRSGYRLFANLELAHEAYGGESEFQRFETSASYHQPVGGGRYLHFALTHSVVFTPDRDRSLPFNKRFFPGGENSVRGYQRGEASPLNARGQEIGAESVIEGNAEFEQALTPLWSVVAFVDGASIAEEVDGYPGDEILWSVGGGIRWNTIIGPVRLEYGHNLNRRTDDPAGTLHFSIGAPF